jgi:hypothetical protein
LAATNSNVRPVWSMRAARKTPGGLRRRPVR